jgi:hypothetical protein
VIRIARAPVDCQTGEVAPPLGLWIDLDDEYEFSVGLTGIGFALS